MEHPGGGRLSGLLTIDELHTYGMEFTLEWFCEERLELRDLREEFINIASKRNTFKAKLFYWDYVAALRTVRNKILWKKRYVMILRRSLNREIKGIGENIENNVALKNKQRYVGAI